MTLLSALGFQPRKRMEMIAPTSISYTDISIVIPVKNNQKGITLFLSEFVKTHSPALYPRERSSLLTTHLNHALLSQKHWLREV
jgi:hypothetical protein